MPRANRYILPGYVYHLTHRCHNREFLLRCRLDRVEYCSRLRDAVRKHHISLFAFCITCNHVHLLGMCDRINDISGFMKQLEGEFAEYYNVRKHRSGAFWNDRFHCTMVDGSDHLWNCLRYVDLNMVRAGVVAHPGEWTWCSYRELMGERERYRLLDVERLIGLLELPNARSLAECHEKRIAEALRSKRFNREGIWTESIAVGGESFIKEIEAKNKKRNRLYKDVTEDGTWYLREKPSCYSNPYDQKRGSQNEPKAP